MGKPKERPKKTLRKPDEVATAKPLVEKLAKAKTRLGKVKEKLGAEAKASHPRQRDARVAFLTGHAPQDGLPVCELPRDVRRGARKRRLSACCRVSSFGPLHPAKHASEVACLDSFGFRRLP